MSLLCTRVASAVRVSRVAHRACAELQWSAASATAAALSRPAHAAAALHTAPARLALFGTEEEKAAKKVKAEQMARKEYWKNFVGVMLTEKFTLAKYEEVIKLQSGEAAEDASWIDKAKASVGQKLRSWQGGEYATPKEVKDVAAILAEMTPEEKAGNAKLPHESKTRIAEKTGQSVGAVNLVLDRYDQFCSISEWFHWCQRSHRPLPTSPSDMQDRMKEDRRVVGMPRKSAMDRRAFKLQRASHMRRPGQ